MYLLPFRFIKFNIPVQLASHESFNRIDLVIYYQNLWNNYKAQKTGGKQRQRVSGVIRLPSGDPPAGLLV